MTGKQISADTVWEAAKSMRIGMLTSWNGQQQMSRPMTARVYKDRHAIYFLDKADSAKEKEIEKYSAVSLSFSDPSSNRFVAISGRAKVENDRKVISEVWSEMDRAYFDSPDDQNIRLITFQPESADMWEGPHKLIAGALMLIAATTGKKPEIGHEKKVAM